MREEPADERDGPPEQYARQSSETSQDDRFEKELQNDVDLSCANCLAHSDLFGTFGYRDQHDIHHSNTAYQQAD